MRDSTSKEKVLKKIRKALIHKTNPQGNGEKMEGAIYPPLGDDLALAFAERFLAIQGQFAYCENKLDFSENLINLVEKVKSDQIFCFEPKLQALLNEVEFPYIKDKNKLHSMQIGLTSCEALVAHTGSVMVSSAQQLGRTMTIYPPIHIVVAYTSQLLPDLKSAFSYLQQKYQGQLPSLLTAIAGPSRTADIEKTLVLGAHGPKELYVFLVEDSLT